MATQIYYFSGTGNSLSAARQVAKILDAGISPISALVRKDFIRTEASSVGIVFPVYNHRIPLMVKQFVEKLHDINSKYLFAIATYGDNPCAALDFIAGLIKKSGGHLSLGYAVKMPYNYINPGKGLMGLFKPFVLREINQTERQRILDSSQEKLDSVSHAVLMKEEGVIEGKFRRLERFTDVMNLRETLQKSIWLKVGGFKGKTDLPYLESVQIMDHAFYADSDCISCGTCEKICPAGNIILTENGPKWQHRCQQCFACLQWCPKSALQFGRGTAGRLRYHHPGISLKDMLITNLQTKGE